MHACHVCLRHNILRCQCSLLMHCIAWLCAHLGCSLDIGGRRYYISWSATVVKAFVHVSRLLSTSTCLAAGGAARMNYTDKDIINFLTNVE